MPLYSFLFHLFYNGICDFLKQEKFSSRKLIGSIIAFCGAALVLVAGHSIASSFMEMELVSLHQYAGGFILF